MRFLNAACVLMVMAGTGQAQQGTSTVAPKVSTDSLNATDTLRVTRAQAIAQALLANPQIAVAREQVDEAHGQRVQNAAIPDPTGTVSVQPQKGQPTTKPVTVGIDIPFPDKFRLQYGIGTAGIRAAEATYAATKQQIAASTAQSYDSLMVALRHHGDLTESLQLAQDFLNKTQARFTAGTAAKLDVVQAQVGVAQAQNALLQNTRDITNARGSLNRLMGRLQALPIAPADTLGVPPALPELAVLEQHALAERPELKGLSAQQKGARATTTLAEEFWLPDITAGATWDLGAPDAYFPTTSPLYSIGISVPVPIFFWQHLKGEIAQDRHHERELAATYRDTYAAVDQDVRTSYANATTALQQLIFIRDQLLPAARDAYHIASVSYGLGGSSALDVIAARTTLVQAESQYSDALATANAAQADLERAAAAPLSQFPQGDVHDR